MRISLIILMASAFFMHHTKPLRNFEDKKDKKDKTLFFNKINCPSCLFCLLVERHAHPVKKRDAEAIVFVVFIVFPFFLMRISRTFSSAKPIKLI